MKDIRQILYEAEKREKRKERIEKVVGFVLLAACGLLAAFLRFFVIVKLWEWFLVPRGLPPLTLATALMLTLLVSLFRSQYAATKEVKFGHMIASHVFLSLFSLALGEVLR